MEQYMKKNQNSSVVMKDKYANLSVKRVKDNMQGGSLVYMKYQSLITDKHKARDKVILQHFAGTLYLPLYLILVCIHHTVYFKT